MLTLQSERKGVSAGRLAVTHLLQSALTPCAGDGRKAPEVSAADRLLLHHLHERRVPAGDCTRGRRDGDSHQEQRCRPHSSCPPRLLKRAGLVSRWTPTLVRSSCVAHWSLCNDPCTTPLRLGLSGNTRSAAQLCPPPVFSGRERHWVLPRRCPDPCTTSRDPRTLTPTVQLTSLYNHLRRGERPGHAPQNWSLWEHQLNGQAINLRMGGIFEDERGARGENWITTIFCGSWSKVDES